VARSRLHRAYGVPLDRIALCPNAFSGKSTVFRGEERRHAALNGCFNLFSFTRYYPHKNLERIVSMFDRFRAELKGICCTMAVSAEQGIGARRLVERIEELGLGDSIRCVGRIEEQDIPERFRDADALFLPTLLESFSGTYLEAMAYGVPIITSDLDFAREICGRAAVFADPFDIEALKNAVLQLKDDAALRSELVEEGRRQLHLYARSWHSILRDVLGIEGLL
jgi:glycosyltransferase involved in cell wall biosynthesis